MATFKKIGKKGQEKWSVVFDIPGYVPRKQKRLSGYKSRSEANLVHIAFLANYKTSIDARQSSNTESFDSLYCSYINYVKNSVKEASYLSIGSAFKNHILPYFKDKDMREILPKNISEWILWIDKRTDLSDKGYRKLGYKSKIKVRGFLSRFFLFCIDNGVLSNNPCDKAFRIKKTETEAHLEKEMSIWDESEFAQFISVVDDLMYKTLFSFLYLSGCRRGEALALTWKDLSGNTVRIRKSISFQSIEGGYRITTPKKNILYATLCCLIL